MILILLGICENFEKDIFSIFDDFPWYLFHENFREIDFTENLLFLLFEMSLHLAHIVHHRSGNYSGGRLFLCLFWTQHIWRLILLENLFVPLKRFRIIYIIIYSYYTTLKNILSFSQKSKLWFHISQTNIVRMLSIWVPSSKLIGYKTSGHIVYIFQFSSQNIVNQNTSNKRSEIQIPI